MEVASPEGWHQNKELVLDFYNQRRKQANSVEPNAAHQALVDTRVVLVAKGTGEGSPILVRRDDLTGFLKVAQHMVDRDDVEVYSDQYGQSILVMGSGLAGRRELAVQVVASQRRAGTGRRLVRSAIALTPQGVPLFAQVGAGNAASLRAFYNAGFRPVGAEVLFPKT